MPKTKQSEPTVEEHATPYDAVSNSQYLPVHDKAAALDTIFRDAAVKHGLTLFARHELMALDLWQKGNRFYLHCLGRRKKVLAKPEEVTRQLCLKRVLDMDYTLDQLTLEVPIKMGRTVHSKAADIVIYREEGHRVTPYIIIELKRPQRRDGLDQLETYMNATGVPFGWWLNGRFRSTLLWKRYDSSEFHCLMSVMPLLKRHKELSRCFESRRVYTHRPKPCLSPSSAWTNWI